MQLQVVDVGMAVVGSLRFRLLSILCSVVVFYWKLGTVM